MYNLLAVDDDYLVVESMRSALKTSKLPFGKIHTATTQMQAKAIFQTDPIDIMICDIEMPKSSGFELMDWVKKNYSNTKSIVLTGHPSFEYAKHAERLGCIDFIMKPIPLNELVSTISKIIYADRKGNEVFYNYYLQNYNQIEAKNFWKDILIEKIHPDINTITVTANERKIPKCANRPVLPVLIKLTDEFSSDGKGALENLYYVEQLVNAVVFSSISGITVRLDHQTLVCVLYTTGNTLSSASKELWKELIKACNAKLKLNLVCIIGSEVSLDKLSTMYKKMQFLAKCNECFTNRVFLLEDGMNGKYKQPNFSDWEAILKQNNKDKIIQEVQNYLSCLQQQGVVNGLLLRRFLLDFVQMLNDNLAEYDLRLSLIANDKEGTELYVKAPFTCDNMIEWVKFIIDKYFYYINESKKNLSIVQEVANYINHNYSEEINRDCIAKKFHINVDYLNRTFKKEMGASLMEYVSNTRMKIAKSLLENSQLKISEIASQVGYNSLSNFTAMFNKKFSINPITYRKNRTKAG